LKRFSDQRDEASFGMLVHRHGPMVQGVCQRILGDVHEAEDAFQAVFLVLARKCASIRKPELLGNWLYGVACRISRKARTRAIRKETWERRAKKMPTQDQILELEWAELKQVLDDELSRMPEKYRTPLVLCYLQGRTNSEAAAQLGWPAGSISGRLARAREILRKRLNRRGLTLSAGLLAVLLSQKAASADVSPLLIEAAIRAGMSGAEKAAVPASVPAGVRELASESANASLAGYMKVMPLAFLVALTIAVLWPSGGLSARSIWTLVESVAFRQSNSVAAFVARENGSADGAAFDETKASKPDAAAVPVPQSTGWTCHSGR
jgi:RNA polymerase sigma factor (sigma-70 family)